MKEKIFNLENLIVVILVGVIVYLISFPKKEIKQVDLCFYENDNNYVLIEKNTLGESVTSYLYKDSQDHYLSKIYEYETENEIKIDDLIKEDKINEYNQKINDLIKLKYPKFVAEALINENVLKSYILRDNEMVIYFNNYQINPEVEEILYLKVNYNEIKDYLNFTVLLDKEYENENGYNYTNAKKAIAITFDDSPNKNKTDKILNALSDNHFHATFFIVGERAINNKDLLISIKNTGNEIGSHTYSHMNMKKSSDEEIINDYNKMNEIYQNIYGEDLKILRPPYGYRNSDYLINYVIDNVKDGDIILFHDSYDSSVNAILSLLPLLYSKGYQVMSVSELFALKGQNLEMNKIYYHLS